MRYRAIVFDLFGTLVDNPPYEEYQEVLRRDAASLSAPVEDFMRLWHDTAQHRSTGVIPTIEANFALICERLGLSANEAVIAQATRLRNDYIASQVAPRADALTTLAAIRARGLKIALVSNCGPETPQIWDGLPLKQLFDATVFSCMAGFAKPDRRIYEMALAALKVKAQDCLYVGDGEGNELAGAAAVGMHPVMISVPYEEADPRHVAARQLWDGPYVSSLTEVLALL